MTVAELARRAGMTVDEVECIEEGGTEPTVALLRRLAAALDADVRLTPGHDWARSASRPTLPENPGARLHQRVAAPGMA